jgi:hypothetical protein
MELEMEKKKESEKKTPRGDKRHHHADEFSSVEVSPSQITNAVTSNLWAG